MSARRLTVAAVGTRNLHLLATEEDFRRELFRRDTADRPEAVLQGKITDDAGKRVEGAALVRRGVSFSLAPGEKNEAGGCGGCGEEVEGQDVSEPH